MSPLLFSAIVFTLACYVLAMGLAMLRLFWGPSAQDRVLAMDLVYTIGMLVLLVLAMRYRSAVYFEAALLIALFGFISAMAMAKFLLRGEVIE
jgi:multicomponent K+:H+ antiporter subunit F